MRRLAAFVCVCAPGGGATTPLPGWHKLDMQAKNRRASVKARPGHLAGS